MNRDEFEYKLKHDPYQEISVKKKSKKQSIRPPAQKQLRNEAPETNLKKAKKDLKTITVSARNAEGERVPLVRKTLDSNAAMFLLNHVKRHMERTGQAYSDFSLSMDSPKASTSIKSPVAGKERTVPVQLFALVGGKAKMVLSTKVPSDKAKEYAASIKLRAQMDDPGTDYKTFIGEPIKKEIKEDNEMIMVNLILYGIDQNGKAKPIQMRKVPLQQKDQYAQQMINTARQDRRLKFADYQAKFELIK